LALGKMRKGCRLFVKVLAFLALISLAFGQIQDPCQTTVWRCYKNEGGKTVAMLKGDVLKDLIPPYFFGTEFRPLGAKFSDDVEHLNIHTDVPVEVKSVAGRNLKTISVSGKQKMIKDLCIFAQPQLLPNLVSVAVHNSELEAFGYQQFLECLTPRMQERNGQPFEVQLLHSTIRMDPAKSPQSLLTFFDLPELTKLRLVNVSFPELDANQLVITQELHRNEDDRVEGRSLFFKSGVSGSCGCDLQTSGVAGGGPAKCVAKQPCPENGDIRPPFVTTSPPDVTTTTPKSDGLIKTASSVCIALSSLLSVAIFALQ